MFNVVALASLEGDQDGQLLALQDGKLVTFPLEELAKVVTGGSEVLPPIPSSAAKVVALHDSPINLLKVGILDGRIIGEYASFTP